MLTWLVRRDTLLQNEKQVHRREIELNELTRRLANHKTLLVSLLREQFEEPASQTVVAPKAISAKSTRRRIALQQKSFGWDADVSTEIASASSEKTIEPIEVHTKQPLAELLEIADNLLAEREQIRRDRMDLQESLDRLTEEMKVANAGVEAANERLKAWQSNWQRLLMQVNLDPTMSPESVTSYVETMSEYFEHKRQSEELHERISGIDADARQFEAKLTSMITAVAPDLTSVSHDDAIVTLRTRSADNQKSEAIRNQQLQRKKQSQQSLDEARRTFSKANQILQELCTASGIDFSPISADSLTSTDPTLVVLGQLETLEKQSELRADLTGKQNRAIAQFNDLARDETDASFFWEWRGHSEIELKAQLNEFNATCERLERRRDDLNHQLGVCDEKLRQMDGRSDAADAEEERRLLLAQIRSDAEQYARLKLATVILSGSIERYRDRIRGPILSIASQIFRELTLGSFEGLRVDENENHEPIIVGLRAGGREPITVEGMSEGTCDQLYLALRIATLRLEHGSTSVSANGECSNVQRAFLPFIVDDVLIQFDDARAEAALRIFSELSQQRQVIFFTHHEHLLDLAQHALPGKHVARRLSA
jgi:uncharacterized protein YhaN